MDEIMDEITSKVFVKVRLGRWTYEEDVTEDILEHFQECQNNGANPDLEKLTFEHYTRPLLPFDAKLVNEVEDHFIFGWWEGFAQSDAARAIWDNDEVSLITLEVFSKPQIQENPPKSIQVLGEL